MTEYSRLKEQRRAIERGQAGRSAEEWLKSRKMLRIELPEDVLHYLFNVMEAFAADCASEKEKQVRELVLAARRVWPQGKMFDTKEEHLAADERLRAILEKFKDAK